MAKVAETARECLNCGNIGTEDLCDICQSEKRANGELCIVEDVADLWAMERAAVFRGRYHVLGGTLSALDAIGPEELRIPKLIDRVATGEYFRSHSGPECHRRWPDHGAFISLTSWNTGSR